MKIIRVEELRKKTSRRRVFRKKEEPRAKKPHPGPSPRRRRRRRKPADSPVWAEFFHERKREMSV